MTIDTIITALNDWAAARNITIVATKRDLPPAELDMRALLKPSEADSAGAGLHVFIDATSNGGPDAHIGFWIPDSLKKGSWSSMADDDGEIPLYWIPEFSNEKELVAFVDRETAFFFLQHIQEATLDEWLADHGISYQVLLHPEFCGDVAFHAEALGLKEWMIVEFSDAAGYGVTLGVSGKGDAATFLSNEDGFLNFDQRVSKLSTPAKLTEWLDSTVFTKN